MMIPEHIKCEILDRAADNLVSIVEGEGVSLVQKGNAFWATCPLPGHDEKTASFAVTPARKSWHCHGCGVGGDVAKFLMLKNGISFPEALKHLAERFNIPLPDGADSAAAKEKKRQIAIMSLAEKFFRNSLATNTNGGKAYTESRMEMAEAELHGVGYAPNTSKALLNYLITERVDLIEAEKLGLIRKNDNRQYQDTFFGRIMFPIKDISGTTVGFGGRRITEGPVKYLNSPETTLFKKSRCLYGIETAHKAIEAEKFAYVVEGYLDVNALRKAQVVNSVGTCGTAFTKEQCQLLAKSGAKRVTFMFDGDKAGIKAIQRGIVTAFGEGMASDVALLPEGEDPDSFIRKCDGKLSELRTITGLEYLEESGAEMTPIMKEMLRLHRLEKGMLYFTQNVTDVARTLAVRGKLEELFSPEVLLKVEAAIALRQ